MGAWDDSLKIFINENAQDFASWIMQGARVKRKLLTEFKVRTITADSLLELVATESEGTEDEISTLLHIEVQSTRDPDIGDRLLGYSYEAQREHQLPVLSCVTYLRDVGNVPQPPHEWKLPSERVFMWFDYVSIELAKIPTDELRQTGLIGLLPLLILTKEGATHQVMQEVVTRLEAAEKIESLAVTKLLAELVFTNDEDQQWIERIFAMHNDVLRQTPTYQKLLKEGREEGLEALRQTLVDVVQGRFPELAALAQKQVENTGDTELLHHLIVKVSTAQTMQEAVLSLVAVDNGAQKN